MNEIERVIDVALKPLRLAPGCVPAYDEARENLVKMVDSLVESAYAAGVQAERERWDSWYTDDCVAIQKKVNPRLRALWGQYNSVSIGQIREILKAAAAIRASDKTRRK